MTVAISGWYQLLFLLLVAPVIWKCAGADCTSGFVDLDRLKSLATRTRTPSNIQRVFPAINFTCNGTINEWTVLAREYGGVTGTQRFPELQVWRSTENDGEYTRVAGTTLTVSVTDVRYDIYVHTPAQPMEFQAGDVFGIFQPNFSTSCIRVVYQRSSGPESLTVRANNAVVPPETFSSTGTFTDYPLVAVTTVPQECANGFALQKRMQIVQNAVNGGLQSLQDLASSRDNLQSVSPNINFTCNGNITKWIMGADFDRDNDIYPELQVWRRVNDSIPDRYYRAGNTIIAIESENRDSRVYEYPVDPPLPVEAGDVLGIYQPSRRNGGLDVYYERDAGPSSLYQTSNSFISQEDFPESGETLQSHSILPLVTVEIAVNPTLAISNSTPKTHITSSPITPTPVGGVDMPASFPTTAVGAGVSVGVAVAIVTLAAVVIIIVMVHRNKKRKKNNTVLNESTVGDITEMSSGIYMTSPGDRYTVNNEAYGTTESVHPIKIHGNDAYQTTDEAIATEQNEAYGGRVEGTGHAHSTTDESLRLECEYDYIVI